MAEPDTLVGRTIELAGEVGILDAQLREVMKPISSERLEVALNRLESGELIHSTKEAHADRRGTLRLRVTWTTGAATRAQETHEP
ncbi:MAG TPA: hypothetical protein VKR21_06250 [Solirubrobacteraceae bacterium]|nr:hypothetical protein [Solirubrobacteraceae bacterium]